MLVQGAPCIGPCDCPGGTLWNFKPRARPVQMYARVHEFQRFGRPPPRRQPLTIAGKGYIQTTPPPFYHCFFEKRARHEGTLQFSHFLVKNGPHPEERPLPSPIYFNKNSRFRKRLHDVLKRLARLFPNQGHGMLGLRSETTRILSFHGREQV